MIIFNFNAIAVGIIIAIICGPIYWLMPDDFANSPLGIIILASIGTLVAGIAEAGGLKGRLFFLPMWLLGVVGTIGYTFIEYSWKGLGVMGGVFVAAFGLILLLAYFQEKSEWKDAYGNFQDLKKIKDPSNKEFWDLVEKSKFFPVLTKWNHLICEHNLEVLAYLKFVGSEWDEIETLIPIFQDASIRGNKIDIDSDLTDDFEARLAEVLESFEEE